MEVNLYGAMRFTRGVVTRMRQQGGGRTFFRGKLTGGCSAINSSVAIRGVPADFAEWAALGNDEWSFERVLPFHRKLERDVDFGGDLHGKGRPIWVERSKQPKWHPLASSFHGFLSGHGVSGLAGLRPSAGDRCRSNRTQSAQRNPRLDRNRLPRPGS